MDWPTISVENTPIDTFAPPHCPWPECRSHLEGGFAWSGVGTYRRKQDDRVVPRFKCKVCRRGFSLQTFAFSYYLKRAALTAPIAAQLLAGSAHRQIGRSLRCAPSTVTRRSARLGRHSMLLQAFALQHVTLDEPIVYDDFEGFAHSQFQPLGVGIPIGQLSWFAYGAEAAPHKRRGRMSPAQKASCAKLSLPRYGDSAKEALTRTLERLLPRTPGTLSLVTDDNGAYARAVAAHPQRDRIRREVHPNPKRGPKGSPRSAVAVLRDRAMFPVDLAHGLLRHSQAHHRRETIAFARRHNALMERARLFEVWKGFVKRRSERDPTSVTPAQFLGLTDQRWDWERVVAQRMFPWQVPLTQEDLRIYRREWVTPDSGPNTRHALRRAF